MKGDPLPGGADVSAWLWDAGAEPLRMLLLLAVGGGVNPRTVVHDWVMAMGFGARWPRLLKIGTRWPKGGGGRWWGA
jgi:hypothetical protein